MSRKPRFELHIRPMFRILDRDHMDSFADLFNYENVRSEFNNILGWVRGGMPPERQGGPWPDEWVALFERWGQENFPRLESSAATYTATRGGDLVTLTARGRVENLSDRVWPQRLNEETSPRRYVLYREPSDTASGPGDFVTEPEVFPYVPGVDTVIVVDEAGEHTVPITAA